MIDGRWWRERESVTPDQDEARHGVKCTDYDTSELQAASPLMFAETVAPVVGVAEAAGFKNVDVSTLS